MILGRDKRGSTGEGGVREILCAHNVIGTGKGQAFNGGSAHVLALRYASEAGALVMLQSYGQLGAGGSPPRPRCRRPAGDGVGR